MFLSLFLSPKGAKLEFAAQTVTKFRVGGTGPETKPAGLVHTDSMWTQGFSCGLIWAIYTLVQLARRAPMRIAFVVVTGCGVEQGRL